MSPQIQAFLDMLGESEGTVHVIGSDDGYNVIVGYGLFHDYADHPRQRVWLKNLGIWSTAAGRYQVLAKYFDAYKQSLNLPNFSPASQDAIAIQQIRECKALADIEAGNLASAVAKCRRIWASLPGAGYGQHEQKMQFLTEVFKNAGGKLA